MGKYVDSPKLSIFSKMSNTSQIQVALDLPEKVEKDKNVSHPSSLCSSHFSQTPYELLKSSVKIKSLKKIYDDKFESSTTKGIDRLSGIQFRKQSKSQFKVIKKKCLNGTYRFSPYLELLRSKGRDKPPRLLAIPTVRDRIVLYALKEILFQIFPDCVPRKLANTYIYDIKKFVSSRSPSEVSILRADVENFYGSINREKLFIKLKKRIKSYKLLSLIKKAIETPIVPNNYSRKDRKEYVKESKGIGIPQGLSISNILAHIYLYDFDHLIKNHNCVNVYYRYVDDILIFSEKDKIDKIEILFKSELKNIDLNCNFNKTYKKSGQEEFEYLGYRFKLPTVTIRLSTIERFIHSITAKFSSYIHNRTKNLQSKYAVDKLKENFVVNLNEKITGAISEKRKYGWIFYFSAINDMSVLYKIDNIIAGLFKRLEDFDRIPPANLKKISRAFYEAKYNPEGGYIHDYNSYQTVKQKSDFLGQRGHLEPEKEYSGEEIEKLFEAIKQRNLSELERDDSWLY
ncbi:reverse transcriptase domain-containing protein [Calothrix sp. PCC 6303]|uniref:reverse transcriptase domain-containing protein n=1 Tax=Calothrix sp. PCC 6303 TaxID=1170562 RepID=UPI0002A05778|nr:reverse transcriptase domain-containing protein [Calothrix sp. PCC 6303]AFZ04462.1 RNA-directed DNA polymerase (Reverse transcriptase) [Calothrix sp. PCC 6303]